MNSVVIVYPDKRFVENDPERGKGHPLRLDLFETYWTKTCPIITPEEFRRRMNLVNKLIDQYRERGYNVNWATFSKEGQVDVPDSENIHWMYKVKKEDRIFPVGISYLQHTREGKYPLARNVLDKMPLGNEVVFGGFHSSDCVMRFADAIPPGKKTKIDRLLTERGIYALVETFEQDLHERLIREGREIVDDDSDDPDEFKMALLEDRLTVEDLRIH